MTPPLPLVIDGDPGIDDAVALALAAASPEVELLAVTTLAGNAPVDVTTDNARRILHLLGRDGIPVAAGASRAVVHVGVHNQRSPHGVNGLGEVELPPSTAVGRTEHALELLAGILRPAPPGSITIAALGPLTNIALLLAVHPDLTDRIREVVVMGGSSGQGNITPTAEFNIWTDPEAAHRVLADSGLNIRLVGLDVTRRATVDGADLAMLRRSSDRAALLADMIAAYGDHGDAGWPLHDVLVVAAIVDPRIIRTLPMTVAVDTTLRPERGRTTFAPADATATQASPPTASVCLTRTPVQVACAVDQDAFRSLVLTRVPTSGETSKNGKSPLTGRLETLILPSSQPSTAGGNVRKTRNDSSVSHLGGGS